MSAWTPDKNAAYLKCNGIKCPECGGTELDAEDTKFDSETTAISEVVCPDCDFTYQDVYQLIGYEVPDKE